MAKTNSPNGTRPRKSRSRITLDIVPERYRHLFAATDQGEDLALRVMYLMQGEEISRSQQWNEIEGLLRTISGALGAVMERLSAQGGAPRTQGGSSRKAAPVRPSAPIDDDTADQPTEGIPEDLEVEIREYCNAYSGNAPQIGARVAQDLIDAAIRNNGEPIGNWQKRAEVLIDRIRNPQDQGVVG